MSTRKINASSSSVEIGDDYGICLRIIGGENYVYMSETEARDIAETLLAFAKIHSISEKP